MTVKQPIVKAVWLRILCAIMLLCVGFAHQPIFPTANANIKELSEYVLPDGSIPIICVSDREHDGVSHPAGKNWGKSCEACRLSAATIVPSATEPLIKPIPRKLSGLVPFDNAFFSATLSHDAAPRAPPISFSLL